MAEFNSKMASRKSIAKMSLELADQNQKMSTRLMGASFLRNSNYHAKVDDYLQILKNPEEDLNLRIKLAEALGWFTLSYKKGDIISTCKSISEEIGIDRQLKNELLKTVNRLEVYMR